MRSNLSKLLNTYVALLLSLGFILLNKSTQAQMTPTCTAGTPTFAVHLETLPSGVWTSPNISRDGQCCGATNPDECVFFYLYLNPNTVALQIDMIGADPAGSLFYELACDGILIPGGSVKCIPQSYLSMNPLPIKFCKPGGNKNIYKITTISKPLFPADDTTRIGCKTQLMSFGVVNSSVTWQSIYPGTPGQYDNYLDSTNVASPTYSALPGAPAYIDYRVCGFPQASICGYSVTVCDTVRVYNYPTLSTVTSGTATFCNNGPGSGVTLTANASGGLAPYTFTWYGVNSSTTQIGTGTSYFATAPGTYYLDLKDKLSDPVNCPIPPQTPISVIEGTVPVVDACPNQTVCSASPSTTVTGTVQYAPGAIWSGGAGTFTPGNTFLNTSYTPSAAELAAGFVKLYLTSTGASGNCVNTLDSTIIYYTQPVVVNLTSSGLGCNSATATINSSVTGGTTPYTYAWSTGETGTSINGSEGNYSLYITDALGCTGQGNINLVAPTSLGLTFNVTNVSVNGGNDGSATANVTGGTAPYSIAWSPSGSGTTITNLLYGIYTATVTDANGCQIAGSTVVNEPRCLGFTANATSSNVNCYGSATGTASVSVTGGTPIYTYTWNTVPAQNTTSVANLNAGVYTVLVTDANGCLQTANVVVTQPTQLTNVMTYTNLTSNGASNGAAAANPFGGSTPYTYIWSNGATTQTIDNLSAGGYTVTITDNNGCKKIDSVRINEPNCKNLTLNVIINNVTCFNGKNGSAIAVVGGASGSYTVTWSTGSTAPSINTLVAGNYWVSVIDSKGCTVFKNFTITQPAALSVGLLPTNVRCFNLNDGTINVTVSGGTYPYTYSWSNGSATEDIINLAPEVYTVNITDANGCTAIATANITEPLPLAATYTAQNVSCIYGANGAAGVSVTGGVFPYFYQWSTGATTSSISNLAGGGYSVMVTDANNCQLNQPLTLPIGQPDSVQVDSFIVACPVPGSGQTQVTVIPTGGSSGSFQVSFNGGPYQPAGVYTAMLNNGTTYTVTLQDGNNCTSLIGDILTINTETKIDSIKFAKCNPVGTSSIPVTVFPSGGAGSPYSVSFTNGSSYLSAGTYTSNLNVGTTYTVIIKDKNGCVSAVQTISLPAVLNASTSVTSNYNGQNISCNGLTNGSALATVSGGVTTYSYSWSTVPTQTTAAASNLGAGTYSVTITDGNNCAVTRTVTLTQPSIVTATAIATSNFNGQNTSCFGASDGAASVTASGGVSPYTYAWSTVPTQTTTAAIGLSAGTYTVLVTDVNSCSATATVVLTQPIGTLTSTLNVTSNYNGQQVSCFGATNASVSVTASNGTGPYTYSWSTTPVQTGSVMTGVGAGTYSVTVTDVNGCSLTNAITVSQPPVVVASASVTSNYNGQNVSCFGLTDASAVVNASGGTAPYTYAWSSSPSQTTSSMSNVGAGTYSVTVTDVNGCDVITSVTVNQPTAVDAQILNLSNYNGYNVSCNGSTNGSIDINVNGGTGAYTYTWSNGPTSQDITGVGAGSYTVMVSDANGCIDILSTSLTEPNVLVVTIDSLSNYNGYNTSCSDMQDASVYVTVSGGVVSYGYTWSNSTTNEDLLNVGAGNYSVIVTDNNLCTATANTVITQPPALSHTYTTTSPLCYGLSTGSIDVTLSGGVTPYTYSWSNSAVTEDLTNITSGNYTLNYTDLNGCTGVAIIGVSQLDSILVTNQVSNIRCYGDTVGSIYLDPTGGTGTYTYAWSNGATTQDVINVLAGVYTATVTDGNGCKFIVTEEITQPPLLGASLNSPIKFDVFNIGVFGASDGSIDCSVSGGVSPYSFLWSNGSTSQNLTNLPAGPYTVIITDTNGCRISREILLTQPLVLEMPEGISPNEDGKNDFFVVHGIESYPDNVLTIYNRWGNIVYKESGYINDWQGENNNGELLPDATYFAILEINKGDIVLKGYVEIRR